MSQKRLSFHEAWEGGGGDCVSGGAWCVASTIPPPPPPPPPPVKGVQRAPLMKKLKNNFL